MATLSAIYLNEEEYENTPPPATMNKLNSSKIAEKLMPKKTENRKRRNLSSMKYNRRSEKSINPIKPT
jgi:hypothetical protein